MTNNYDFDITIWKKPFQLKDKKEIRKQIDREKV